MRLVIILLRHPFPGGSAPRAVSVRFTLLSRFKLIEFSLNSFPFIRITTFKVIPAVDNKRPVNLDIGTIRLPITSYVSILHRASGVILFFSVAVFLWLLDASLASEQSFDGVKTFFANPICQFIIWGSLAALAYHAVAGIRHLIMDFGLGEESFESGRVTAWIALVVAVVLIALVTGWVFLW